jgi:hypothetical protein
VICWVAECKLNPHNSNEAIDWEVMGFASVQPILNAKFQGQRLHLFTNSENLVDAGTTSLYV